MQICKALIASFYDSFCFLQLHTSDALVLLSSMGLPQSILNVWRGFTLIQFLYLCCFARLGQLLLRQLRFLATSYNRCVGFTFPFGLPLSIKIIWVHHAHFGCKFCLNMQRFCTVHILQHKDFFLSIDGCRNFKTPSKIEENF